MLGMNFHHAGIATDDADTLADRYAALFDASIVHEERFDGMAVSFLDLGSGYFELLEPREDGPIARYLDSHGPARGATRSPFSTHRRPVAC